MRHYEINLIGGNRLGAQSPLIHTVSYIKRMGVIGSQTRIYIQGQVLAFAAQIWYVLKDKGKDSPVVCRVSISVTVICLSTIIRMN